MHHVGLYNNKEHTLDTELNIYEAKTDIEFFLFNKTCILYSIPYKYAC